MAIVVEHEKRKREILKKALDVFTEEGYEDVTFQKIADRCGITRTTLYIYFRNKHEIFLWSIKQLTEGLENNLKNVIKDTSLTATECLHKTILTILDACEHNKQLYSVLLIYLMQLKKTGADPGEKVRRRILHLHHLLNVIFIRGMKNGEFKKLDVGQVYELFFSLIESAIFRLAVLNEDSLVETRAILQMTINELLVIHK
ncbi:MAG: TetR/AcrR family transcriptional regulator [Treponema sp.]|nr:TetR/AcrR family transcriptional regulator [Treponema sp.]